VRYLNKVVTVAALMAVAQTVSAQQKWDFPTGYGVNTFQTQNNQQFIDEVQKAANGKIVMTLHPGGSLYKANEIKRAVQTRQAQIGEFILSGASNENALFGVDAIPFLATSYAEAKKLSMVARPALEKVLSEQGMKLLYVAPWPPQGLYSEKPVQSVADLNGTKMRTYNPATNRIAQLVTAQPTTIQLAELSQALATGAVDNFLTSSASGVETKLYEQVKYFYNVNAWLPKNAVVVSKKSFDGLDKATQALMLKAAEAAEARGWKVSEEKDAEYKKELVAKGMKVAAPSEQLSAELNVIGKTMTAEWIKVAGPEGKQIIDAYQKK
jgi:TRAP-type C4-dicarboxylate transport system substrate-binding protein